MEIKIRKQKLSDAKEIRALLNDKEVLKQLTGYDYPVELSKIEKEIEDSTNNWKKRKAYVFTILMNNKIAGNVMLECPSKDKKTYNLGFFVGRKFWGKGVATESIKQIIKYAFEKLNINKIKADNDSINPASGRVMEKAGMKSLGIKRKYVKRENKFKFVNIHFWEIINRTKGGSQKRKTK